MGLGCHSGVFSVRDITVIEWFYHETVHCGAWTAGLEGDLNGDRLLHIKCGYAGQKGSFLSRRNGDSITPPRTKHSVKVPNPAADEGRTRITV